MHVMHMHSITVFHNSLRRALLSSLLFADGVLLRFLAASGVPSAGLEAVLQGRQRACMQGVVENFALAHMWQGVLNDTLYSPPAPLNFSTNLTWQLVHFWGHSGDLAM